MDLAELQQPGGDSRTRKADATLSAVVPMHNEAELAARFLLALRGQLAALAGSWEIVVVNDGSTDPTREEVLRVAKECRVHYVELSRNFGKEAALSAGLEAARGAVVVLLDADFQHPLGAIPGMLEKWREGYEMVYGVRRRRAEEGVVRRAGAGMFYRLLAKWAHVAIPEDAGDFRLLDRKVVEALKRLPERTRFMKGLYAWVGFRCAAVEFDVQPRAGGESKYGHLELARLAFLGITAFTTLPLRMVSVLGYVVSALAVGYGAWVAIEELVFDIPIPGYPTIVAGMMLLSGVQLVCLGIIGEYVGRVFDEVKGRPNYIVSGSADFSPLKGDAPGGSGAA